MLSVIQPGESITVVMGGAANSVNPTYSAIYSEQSNSPVGANQGSLNGVTAVTVVSGGARDIRILESLGIYNGDNAAVTITVSKVSGGTSYPIFVRTLAAGDVLLFDSNGLSITSSASVPTGLGSASVATVTASQQGIGLQNRTVLTLDAVELTVGNTTGVSFGGVKLYDFPVGRTLIDSVLLSNVSVGLGNAGNATPIAGTHGGDMSLGSTAPDDGTLTGADVDLCPSTSIDPISGGIAGAALAAAAQFDGTTTALDLYLNMLIDDLDVADGASDVLEISGQIEILWRLGGNYAG